MTRILPLMMIAFGLCNGARCALAGCDMAITCLILGIAAIGLWMMSNNKNTKTHGKRSTQREP